MERYSVMFEKQLKPQATILERRQGSKKKLRPLTEDNDKSGRGEAAVRLQRRNTSPLLPTQRGMVLEGTKARAEGSGITSAVHDLRGGAIRRAHSAYPNMTLQAPAVVTSPVWSEASLPPTPTSSTAQTFVSVGEEFSLVTGTPSTALSQPDGTTLNQRARPRRVDSLTPQSPPDVTELQHGQIGIARTISLSRANKPMQRSFTVKQPCKPTVVDVSKRQSTAVVLEHA